ncbi:PucR-like helix-turn-helix protein [Tamaricihabitans halophyticus]|uniref:PucR-like helix-turn-helix protein n=2 Tax=Tamaricihabitans halophyticus TaxID=1262583 RepID=A0A4R2QGX6_9PSEU|nr:PucR-like helix-turn-helix protein [Tamaricihabitans halophyticus]
MVAYSKHVGTVDPVRTAGILTRECPPDVGAWQDEHIRGAHGPVRVPANVDLEMTARLAVPLRLSGKLYGHLWVLEGATRLTEAEQSAAATTAAEIAELFDKAEQDRDRRIRRDQAMLDTVLDDKRREPPDFQFVPSRQRAMTVLVIAPVTGTPPHPFVPPLPDAELLGALSALPHQAVLTGIRSGMVTALLPVETMHTKAVQLREATARQITAHRAVAGAAHPVHDGAELRSAERRARYAAEVAAADPTGGDVRTWSDLGALRLLAERAPLFPTDVEELFPEATTLLSSRTGATFATSVEAFLDNGGNIGTTAKHLCVHRATLYYRLERAAALVDVDLSDGAARTALHLGLKAARLAGLLGS